MLGYKFSNNICKVELEFIDVVDVVDSVSELSTSGWRGGVFISKFSFWLSSDWFSFVSLNVSLLGDSGVVISGVFSGLISFGEFSGVFSLLDSIICRLFS